MVEGLKEQLSLTNTPSEPLEGVPVKPLPSPHALSEGSPRSEACTKAFPLDSALPEHVQERMSNLIQGSAEVKPKLQTDRMVVVPDPVVRLPDSHLYALWH